jgi:Calx-beta domain
MAFILSSALVKVAEGNLLRFAVLREGDASLEERVIVTSSSGTAKEGIDFDRIHKELVFHPRTRQIDIDVKIHKDGILEFTENFRIQLLESLSISGVRGHLGEPNIMTVKILDIDTN